MAPQAEHVRKGVRENQQVTAHANRLLGTTAFLGNSETDISAAITSTII
jgi:hypothetical protein